MTKPSYGKLDPQIKERWLIALRSGLYAQGQKRLKKTDGIGVTRHCCLGVLCQISPERLEEKPVPTAYQDDSVKGNLVHIHSFKDKYVDTYGYSASIPPEPFSTDIGLTRTAISRLVNMNDDGSSFEEIADFIEEKL